MAAQSFVGVPLSELVQAHFDAPLRTAAVELFQHLLRTEALYLTLMYIFSQPVLRWLLGHKGESYKRHNTVWKTIMFLYNAGCELL